MIEFTKLLRGLAARRTQVYCVGTAKSGTHSIADLFGENVRAQHEPYAPDMIRRIIERGNGQLTDEAFMKFLKWRDRRLGLEIDSSQLNAFYVDLLVRLFPRARFILTIRDPYTWLDSLINHSLSDSVSTSWARMRDFRFRPDLHDHPPEEKILADKGLYTLDGYLSYWAYHNTRVLDTVPSERMLTVRTSEITQQAQKIIDFTGIRNVRPDEDGTHSFKARGKYTVLNSVDQAYLKQKISEHCAVLCARFFLDYPWLA